MLKVHFTKEALGLMTREQRDKIRDLAETWFSIEVSVAFDLPTGYLAVWLRDTTASNNIYGGIDPEGNMST